ncbi:hypothetical protein ISCGN_018392 [Ixodes scapularis]|uniref:Uncharacterized protein n=1 Tax=Ixodes scapularis TaxID=6945 RepID=B7QJL2_IXOSC|nr:hypothetical protein IscW_ISCW014007 [Ixodes scapularis]|eukprot:XP_002415369.1 hypothetical protein IscW_ISCW014007 [Ixodes scapularis]
MTDIMSKLKTAVVLLERLDPGMPGAQWRCASREDRVLRCQGSPFVLLERLPPGSPCTLRNLHKLPYSHRHPQVVLKRLSQRPCPASKKVVQKQQLNQYPLVVLERLPFNFDRTKRHGKYGCSRRERRRRCPSLSEGIIAAKIAAARKAPRLKVP